jgi:hypothetical protein
MSEISQHRSNESTIEEEQKEQQNLGKFFVKSKC